MPKEIEPREGEEAARRFLGLAKKVVNVPKTEIDRRAKEWREARESDKGEEAKE